MFSDKVCAVAHTEAMTCLRSAHSFVCVRISKLTQILSNTNSYTPRQTMLKNQKVVRRCLSPHHHRRHHHHPRQGTAIAFFVGDDRFGFHCGSSLACRTMTRKMKKVLESSYFAGFTCHQLILCVCECDYLRKLSKTKVGRKNVFTVVLSRGLCVFAVFRPVYPASFSVLSFIVLSPIAGCIYHHTVAVLFQIVQTICSLATVIKD